MHPHNFYPEDGGSMFLQNIRNLTLYYMVTEPEEEPHSKLIPLLYNLNSLYPDSLRPINLQASYTLCSSMLNVAKDLVPCLAILLSIKHNSLF
jgi:hypothetical protein